MDGGAAECGGRGFRLGARFGASAGRIRAAMIANRNRRTTNVYNVSTVSILTRERVA
jgi:hypothetical protein